MIRILTAPVATGEVAISLPSPSECWVLREVCPKSDMLCPSCGDVREAYKSGGVVGWGGKGHDRDRH